MPPHLLTCQMLVPYYHIPPDPEMLLNPSVAAQWRGTRAAPGLQCTAHPSPVELCLSHWKAHWLWKSRQQLFLKKLHPKMLQCSRWLSKYLLWPDGSGWCPPDETCAGQSSSDSAPSVSWQFHCLKGPACWLDMLAVKVVLLCSSIRMTAWLDELSNDEGEQSHACSLHAAWSPTHEGTWQIPLSSFRLLVSFYTDWEGILCSANIRGFWIFQWWMAGTSRCRWHYSTKELSPSLCWLSRRCFYCQRNYMFYQVVAWKNFRRS